MAADAGISGAFRKGQMRMGQRKGLRQQGYFALLFAAYYCIIAVQTGYFSLTLSRQGLSEGDIGRVAVVTSTASLLAPPLWGWLCDRRQINRGLFILGAAVAPLSFYAMQHTGSFGGAAVWGGVFYAFCICLQSVPAGWIAALNAEGRQISYSGTRAFGSLSFAFVSVLLGSVVDRFGTGCLPAFLAAFGVLLSAVTIRLPAQPAIRERYRKAAFLQALTELLHNRPYVILLLCSILYGIPSGIFFTYFPVYFAQLGGTDRQLGIAMFVLAVVEVPVMLFYAALEKKIPVRWLVLLSILGYGAKGICVSLAADPGWAIACLVLQIFGLALSVPACQSFIASCTPAAYAATAQTCAVSVCGIGMIAANMLGAWLVTVVDLRAVFYVTSYFSFAGALIFLLGVCLPERKKNENMFQRFKR